jgi:hypothetical protein
MHGISGPWLPTATNSQVRHFLSPAASIPATRTLTPPVSLPNQLSHVPTIQNRRGRFCRTFDGLLTRLKTLKNQKVTDSYADRVPLLPLDSPPLAVGLAGDEAVAPSRSYGVPSRFRVARLGKRRWPLLGKVRLNTINHQLQKLGVPLSEVMFSFKSRQRAPRLFRRILLIRWKLIGKFLGVARHYLACKLGDLRGVVRCARDMEVINMAHERGIGDASHAGEFHSGTASQGD